MEDSRKLINCVTRIERGEDRLAIMTQYNNDLRESGRAAVLASLEEGKTKMDMDLLMSGKTATQGLAKW
jgi:hypothetical protein